MGRKQRKGSINATPRSHRHLRLQLPQLRLLVLFLRLFLLRWPRHYSAHISLSPQTFSPSPRPRISPSTKGTAQENSHSPFTPAGSLPKLSATGSVPVFNIFSSRFSCSRAARSASSSSSSIGSVMGMEVMALPISVVSSCCSRSCSLAFWLASGLEFWGSRERGAW